MGTSTKTWCALYMGAYYTQQNMVGLWVDSCVFSALENGVLLPSGHYSFWWEIRCYLCYFPLWAKHCFFLVTFNNFSVFSFQRVDCNISWHGFLCGFHCFYKSLNFLNLWAFSFLAKFGDISVIISLNTFTVLSTFSSSSGTLMTQILDLLP